MKAMQEVFGTWDAPALKASEILDQSSQVKTSLVLMTEEGQAISMIEFEAQMNAIARSMIAIGVSANDTIFVGGLSYKDALLVYLAAEQIGVNVVNVDSVKEETLLNIKPRLSVVREEVFVKSKFAFGDFLILQEASDEHGSNAISWTDFLDLSRFATDWELERLRVIPA
jgi:hypothetical protein